MKKKTQLTRNCLACGFEKPLAVFLQISGAHGTNYGNICAACRSASAKGKKIISPTDDDDSSRGSSGLRIDAKERIHTEIRQKIEEKKSHDSHKEELEKREKITLEKNERTDKKLQNEKDHRQSYLDAKQKQGFLNYNSKNSSPLITQKPLSQQPIEINTSNAENQQLETQHLEQSIAHEKQLTTIDTSQIFIDSQFGELKFQSVTFRQFKDWLGEGPNFRSMERLYKTKSEVKNPKQKNKEEKKSDLFLEFERKNWKPPSGRR